MVVVTILGQTGVYDRFHNVCILVQHGFATQNPGDLLSSDQGRVVATNPALVFFGAQRPGEAAAIQNAFNLSTRQRGFLEAARRGDFLLAAGADRVAVRVQAPPWQEEAMRAGRALARPQP